MIEHIIERRMFMKEKEKKKSITEIVSSIVENTKCFISQEKIVFAEIEQQGKLIIVPIDGEVFKNYLLYKIFMEEQKINTEVINHIILLIKAKAQYDGETIITANRIGVKKGIFYYDLAKEENRYIRISSKGYKIVQESPVVFNKKSITSTQVLPKENENYSLWELKKYFNIAKRRIKESFE